MDPTRNVGVGAPGEDAAVAPLAGLGDLERYDLRVLQSLRRIIRSVDIHSRRLASQHKITAPQLICLLHVVEEGSVTVTGLARAVHLSASTVIGILDRLESKGLINRQRSTRDRRQVLVTATETGTKLTLNAPSPLQDTLADALQMLPQAEQATIAESLERIVELMEVRHLDASPVLTNGPMDAVAQPDPRKPVDEG